MSIKNYKLLFLIGLFFSLNLKSQITISAHTDFGENNVSEGLYIKSVGIALYKINKFKFQAGFQYDIKSISDNNFTGTFIKASRTFTIKKFIFDVEGFYMYNTFSELMHETNWGFVFKQEMKHFVYNLGTNFRTFKITNKAIDEFNIKTNTKVREYWNIMYLLQYNLKPIENNWNVGISITNIDYFIINQETNPVFFLQGKYKFKAPVTIFIETWYKSAGSFNISVNYFGYFVRTGLKWEIN